MVQASRAARCMHSARAQRCIHALRCTRVLDVWGGHESPGACGAACLCSVHLHPCAPCTREPSSARTHCTYAPPHVCAPRCVCTQCVCTELQGCRSMQVASCTVCTCTTLCVHKSLAHLHPHMCAPHGVRVLSVCAWNSRGAGVCRVHHAECVHAQPCVRMHPLHTCTVTRLLHVCAPCVCSLPSARV